MEPDPTHLRSLNPRNVPQARRSPSPQRLVRSPLAVSTDKVYTQPTHGTTSGRVSPQRHPNMTQELLQRVEDEIKRQHDSLTSGKSTNGTHVATTPKSEQKTSTVADPSFASQSHYKEAPIITVEPADDRSSELDTPDDKLDAQASTRESVERDVELTHDPMIMLRGKDETSIMVPGDMKDLTTAFSIDEQGHIAQIPLVPNVNQYQQKKNLAQGMMDLALLSANASQLRYVLETTSVHPFFYSSILFIAISILAQIMVGVGLILNSRYDVTDEKEICKADKINNMTVLGVFLITFVNVFIAAFCVTTVTPHSAFTPGALRNSTETLDDVPESL